MDIQDNESEVSEDNNDIELPVTFDDDDNVDDFGEFTPPPALPKKPQVRVRVPGLGGEYSGGSDEAERQNKLPEGFEAKVTIKGPPKQPKVVVNSPDSLSWLLGASEGQIRVKRMPGNGVSVNGKASRGKYKDRTVGHGECGFLEICPAQEMITRIQESWGGGTYELVHMSPEGKPMGKGMINLAQDPKPLEGITDEEDEEEEETPAMPYPSPFQTPYGAPSPFSPFGVPSPYGQPSPYAARTWTPPTIERDNTEERRETADLRKAVEQERLARMGIEKNAELNVLKMQQENAESKLKAEIERMKDLMSSGAKGTSEETKLMIEMMRAQNEAAKLQWERERTEEKDRRDREATERREKEQAERIERDRKETEERNRREKFESDERTRRDAERQERDRREAAEVERRNREWTEEKDRRDREERERREKDKQEREERREEAKLAESRQQQWFTMMSGSTMGIKEILPLLTQNKTSMTEALESSLALAERIHSMGASEPEEKESTLVQGIKAATPALTGFAQMVVQGMQNAANQQPLQPELPVRQLTGRPVPPPPPPPAPAPLPPNANAEVVNLMNKVGKVLAIANKAHENKIDPAQAAILVRGAAVALDVGDRLVEIAKIDLGTVKQQLQNIMNMPINADAGNAVQAFIETIDKDKAWAEAMLAEFKE